MAHVNIAFSSGIDSTALLMMALRKGFTVNLHMINVSGIPETMMFEAYTMHLIVEETKKMVFKSGGKVKTVSYRMQPPFPARMNSEDSENGVCNSIVQQFCTVLGMADIRRMNTLNKPGTWIGWNKDDASETSLDEYDHSEQDYQDLVTLMPKLIGRFGNGDNLETPFRMPLWNMSKQEIYDMLPTSLRELVLVNGKASAWIDKNKVVYNAYESKLKEVSRLLDKEMPEHWDAKLSDIPAHIRIMCGYGLPSDVGLPDNETTQELVQSLSKLYASKFDVVFDRNERGEVLQFRNFVHGNIELVTKLAEFKAPKEEEAA